MSDVPLPNASGIYKITCTANKKIYIGSAFNLSKRKRAHFNELRRNRHGNQKLQRAWNKYGEQAFTFEILELVLSMSLTAREQYWFKKLKPFGRKGFNIAREAGSQLGFSHLPEAREKIRQANLNNKHNLGTKWSPEAREKMSQAKRGKKLTAEHIEKVRNAQIGKKKTPEAIEKNRQAQIGKKHTPEHIEKNRQSKLGNKHHLGHKHTPETCEKISQAKKKPSLDDDTVKREAIRKEQEG